MSEIQIKQGNIIYEKDKALTMVSVIMVGTIHMELPDKTIELGSGDVIGVLDLCTGVHSCSYVATSDVVVDSYPYKSVDSLHKIMQEDSTFSKSFVSSALKQFFDIADLCHISTFTCNSLYAALMEYHRDYTKLCKQYQIPAKNLPGLEFIQPLVLDSKPDSHINAFYKDVQKMCGDPNLAPVFDKFHFVSGFLMNTSQDMHRYLNACDEMNDYMSHLTQLLINEEKIDFLDLYTSLLTHAAHKREDTVPLVSAISKMFIRSKNVTGISEALYQARLTEYRALSQELESLSQQQSKEEISEAVRETEEKLNILCLPF